MHKIRVKNFDLLLTLESGQFFSYKKTEDDIFLISAYSKLFIVKQQGNYLFFDGVDSKFIKNFFSLNLSYEKRLEEISKDKTISDIVNRYRGLRIMKQDVRECILSFICSSISNIPKIKKNTELLSRYFGKKKKIKKYEWYTFPERLGSYKIILKCKTGFRAKYLKEADKILDNHFIEKLKKSDYTEAKRLLMRIRGVGKKIADCVCLFSLGHYEAFPVDIWIKRIVSKKYFHRDASEKEVESFCKKRFGENAGIVQQFLYIEAIKNGKKYR